MRILPLFIFLVTLLQSINQSAASWKHEGCYKDKADIQLRSLPYVQMFNETMTVDMCQSTCEKRGFEWSGLQFKTECYCSKNPPRYDKLPAEKCSIPCAGGGDKPCGGAGALSVYQNTAVQPPRDPVETKRPLLCLVMILKNEAHTIMDTLQTVKDAVDCWYILDTGSTDGTQKIIKDFWAGHHSKLLNGQVPGQLFEEPFVDYGATRNRILVLAKQHGNPIYTLMLSADERLDNPDVMRAYLTDHRYSFGTMHGAYPVVMNTGLKFDSIRLARVDAGWRYKARVHEYLAPPTGPYVGLFRSEVDINVMFSATDGERRFQSQFFIKKILEEDLERDPHDTRSIYYLARTNSGINNHTASFYYYDLLAKRSTWEEEVYHGLTMKAIEARQIDTISWKERQTMLIDAFMYKPTSMDALHALAQDHFDSGRYHLAFLFIHRAVHLKPPAGLETVENVLLRPTQYLYDYEGYRLMGFAAREIGEWEACVYAFRKVLARQVNDEIVKSRIVLCEEKVKALNLAVADIRPDQTNLNVIPSNVEPVPRPPGPGDDVQVDEPAPQSFSKSLAYGFSFTFTLNLLAAIALLGAFLYFASKKFSTKKLKQ